MHLRRPSRSSSAQAHADERDADDDLLANYSQPVGPMVGPKRGGPFYRIITTNWSQFLADREGFPKLKNVMFIRASVSGRRIYPALYPTSQAQIFCSLGRFRSSHRVAQA